MDLEDLGSMATKLQRAKAQRNEEEGSFDPSGAKIKIGEGEAPGFFSLSLFLSSEISIII